MLNRNEDFAGKQTDAFIVMQITKSLPLDHEEAYSVNRRQSQMRYSTLLRAVRRGLNCTFPLLMPHGFPVKFRAKCTTGIAQGVYNSISLFMRSPEVCFSLSPRGTESSRENRSEISNYDMLHKTNTSNEYLIAFA